MALGGYKFSGRFCQKGSLTDLEWISLLHKTKVTAFMEANSAANAGWEYDMGDSPDGNSHSLDSAGNNYVTVFKRVNSETHDTTWFALYTLCKHTKTGTDTDAVNRSLAYGKWSATTDYNFHLGTYVSSFFRVGTSKISYNDDLLDIDTLNDSTPLIPTGNPGTATNYNDSDYYGYFVSFFNNSTFYFGIAIKDDNVIIFSGEDQTSSELCCAIASGHGFSNLIIPGDTHTPFALNLQNAGNGGTYDEVSPRATVGTKCPVSVALNDSGAWVTPVGLFVNDLALYVSTLNGAPYQAISVSGISNNANGIMGKGTLNLELIAWNAASTYTVYPTVYTAYANGNYLCVSTYNSSEKFTAMNDAYLGGHSYGCLFVGWDSSNPDITQSSSWTEVTSE